jgi:hypothetical protein
MNKMLRQVIIQRRSQGTALAWWGRTTKAVGLNMGLLLEGDHRRARTPLLQRTASDLMSGDGLLIM